MYILTNTQLLLLSHTFLYPIGCSQSSGEKTHFIVAQEQSAIRAEALNHSHSLTNLPQRHGGETPGTKNGSENGDSNSIYCNTIVIHIYILYICYIIHNHLMCTCQHHGSTFPQESNPEAVYLLSNPNSNKGNCLNEKDTQNRIIRHVCYCLVVFQFY